MKTEVDGKIQFALTGYVTEPDKERVRRAMEKALTPIVGLIDVQFNGKATDRLSISTKEVPLLKVGPCVRAIRDHVDRTCPIHVSLTF